MAGKKNGKGPAQRPEAEAPSDPYKLKYQAVEDLVTANEENSPPVSAQELRKYHAGSRVKMADWVKAILLKIWFAGVICYFFVWGLSTYTIHHLDQMLVMGVMLGLVTNLLTNNIYRLIAKEKGKYDRWMMFPRKGWYWMPLDILYGVALVAFVMMTYNVINTWAAPADGTAVLQVEPFLFGIFTTLWDLLFLGFKRLGSQVLRDAKRSASHSR